MVTCTDIKIVENKKRVDEPSGERTAWRVVTCTYVKIVENKRRSFWREGSLVCGDLHLRQDCGEQEKI